MYHARDISTGELQVKRPLNIQLWPSSETVNFRAMQCAHCGEPEPGPHSFEKAERDHAEEMARLEENKQRQEQWLRDNRLILCLAGVLFAIPLSFILVDLFDVWLLLGY